MSRLAILQEIEKLDPVKDHQRIVFLSCCYEFPFDTTRALEFAVFRLRGTFAGLLPARRRPRLRTKIAHPSYPNGYVIEELGPPNTN